MIIRYTDDDFVTTTIQVDPQYTRNPSIDQYNEYRYIWTDNNSINNDIYFLLIVVLRKFLKLLTDFNPQH